MQEKGYYYPEGEIYGAKMTGRVAMKDLFHMTAGTSTGSIIAAGLTYPNETTGGNPMNATDLIDIYKNRGG